MTAPKRASVPERMQAQFKVFLSVLWKSLGLPKPTRAQLVMANYLQFGPQRLQLQMFRGIGKSWVACAFVLWTLYCDPNKKVLLISASRERADANALFMQKCIKEIPWLNHLEPQDDSLRWSRVSFDVQGCTPSQAPSVRSAGIGSQITGSRADIIIPDDCEVPGNSATDMMREKLLYQLTELEAILMPLPTSRILYLGTPQTAFTVYRTLSGRGYKALIWPALYPEDTSLYTGDLADELVADIENGAKPGEPTDTRFNATELEQRRFSMGNSAFQLQFMLNTTLSDAERFPLRFADLIVTSIGDEVAERYAWSNDPRYIAKELQPVGLPGDRFYNPMFIAEGIVPFTETIMAVDPSGRGSDETVTAVLSQANGYIFLRKMSAYRDGYSDETLAAIVREAKHYGATLLVIESNFGDGTVCRLIERHIQEQGARMGIEEVRSTTRKEARIISTLEPVMNQHKLVVDPKVFKWDYSSNADLTADGRLSYMLMYQMSRLSDEPGALKHDDRVDALALGVKHFTDVLAISAHKEVARRKREQWEAMEKLFEEAPHAAVEAMATGREFAQVLAEIRSGGGRGRQAMAWVRPR